MRRTRGPRTICRPCRVGSNRIRLPSSDASRELAYLYPAEPPYESSPKPSASASASVDFPEPFSPTRKVTGARKASPSSASWRTHGTVQGQPFSAVPSPSGTST